MSTRQRMTWDGDRAARKASAHPATPWEGETHPAAVPDPEADDYMNGDPSSWAEDPHPPPYRTSPAPANPMDDGGYRHPATQPGAPAKNASINVRIAAEKKAAKCIRIATALLGTDVADAANRGDKVATGLIEDQALDFMDLPDARIASTLLRLEASMEDPETLLRKMQASEDEDDTETAEDEDEGKTDKKANRQLMAAIQSLQAEIATLKKGYAYMAGDEPAPVQAGGDDEALLAQLLDEEKVGGHIMAEDDDEALLAQMMDEEKMGGRHMAEDDDEALLAQMMDEEKMGGHHMAEDDDEALLAQMMDEEKKATAPAAPAKATPKATIEIDEVDEPVMGGLDDPMALDGDLELDPEDDSMLAGLFANTRSASDDGDEDAETAAEDEADEKASKKATLRPQPRKASVGPQKLSRVASAPDDQLADLGRLWAAAPDVSKIF